MSPSVPWYRLCVGLSLSTSFWPSCPSRTAFLLTPAFYYRTNSAYCPREGSSASPVLLQNLSTCRTHSTRQRRYKSTVVNDKTALLYFHHATLWFTLYSCVAPPWILRFASQIMVDFHRPTCLRTRRYSGLDCCVGQFQLKFNYPFSEGNHV